jgi:acyl-CoA thioester hydrolase
MEIDFLGSARIDDILEVKTSLVSTTGVRLRLEQNVVIGDKHLLKALVSVVLLGDNGRVTRFPNTLLTKFRDYLS